MPAIIVLPKMGMTMTEGTLAQWLVPDGAPVEKGQPIFRMLTEKINTEVEAEASGVLRHLVPEDSTVPAGAVVGCILAQDEELPAELVEMAASAAAPAAAAPAAAASGAGRGVPPARETGEFVRASPLARRLAEEAGIDLSQVEGTGPGGRILQEDVERAIAARPEAPAPAMPPAGRTIAFKGVRRTIAQRMHESLQTMAQLTITMEVDVTEAGRMCQELSERWQAEPGGSGGVSVTYTHAIVKAAALALAEHPRLNSTLEGDIIRLLDEVNVGLAVSLDEGLIVPVVREADRKPLRQIAIEARELSEKARQGTLTVDEVTGGTFTLTTLGMYDVDVFTPIVNPPQCAILGVGRVKEVPAFLARGGQTAARPGESASGGEGDQVVRRSVLNLSLSFDHRVVDGAPAAEFLRRVKHYLEHPDLLLAEQ
jgi:pyruvate dehydrogenase E2 component (dihydrolipoamide acetyltransferase)